MPEPVLAHWVATRRSRSLIVRLLPAIASLLLLIGLGGYLLVKNALSQDADVQQRSRVFIARTVDQVRNEIGRNIINYSKWGEAYQHLHLTVDKPWADEQRNVGDIPYDLYGYNGIFVIDAHDRTVYTVIDGKPSALRVEDWLQGDVAGLVAQARGPGLEDDSVVRAMRVGDTPALVAAATITPGWTQIPRIPGPDSVMIFVTILDPNKLAHLSDTYGLPAITMATSALPEHESMPLLASAIHVNWVPPRPGMHLLRQTLPLFIAGVLALAGVLLVLLRHAMASARQLDAQFDALLLSQAELTASERRFRDIAEASSDWLWEVDASGRLTYLSGRFSEVTGARREDWLGQPLTDLLEPQGISLPQWLARTQSDSSERDTLVCHYQDPYGRSRICTITCRAREAGRGHRGTATDITDEVQAQAEVRHLSLHDSLTGLPNRLQLQQYLTHRLDQLRPQPLALLSLDLDRFKPVNDALGHAAGDLVLQEVARRLLGQATTGGMVARLGGDEFIVVLPGAVDAAAIDGICEQLVTELSAPFSVQGQSVFMGTSIGVALAPVHACTAGELLRMADIALYQAKSAGRGTWCFYAEDMNVQLLVRRQLEQELREALTDQQLCLHYQPRYATVGGALLSFEALVRWQHPRHGLLMPDLFIPLAEETGLICALGRWVLEAACHEAAHWPAHVGLSVNLSPGQFDDKEDMAGSVSRALAASGLAAQRLELEITERVLLDHAKGALATLQSLKALGVRLSLDDFGTGFSSLAYLRSYPLDGIKIDRSFIANVCERSHDSAIVKAMIDLGRALDITVTAEGVETSDQLECLRQHPCDEVQGFHFSMAVPAEGLAPLLAGAARLA